MPDPAPEVAPPTQVVSTTGQASSAAQQSGNQLNVFLQGGGAAHPTVAPPADQAAGPRRRAAGVLPDIWNLEPRNAGFTGREEILDDLHERLHSGGAATVQALQGMGGIGKTQLAIEYAYRHSDSYDMVWWMSAEQAGLIGEQYSALGVVLGLIDRRVDSTVAEHAVKPTSVAGTGGC